MPRLLTFHHDSWEGNEEPANLTMEDSWQTLLDNSEVNKHGAAPPPHHALIHCQSTVWTHQMNSLSFLLFS